VLLVDDCSTQDIASIVDSYKDKLSIRYIRNAENVGCGMTRQKGIDETKADYITFLDSDDILLPNAVNLWLDEIRKTKPDMIYSPFFFVTKDSILIRQDDLLMCHGKVYNVNFLKKYDIGESPEVLCIDDAYLNWQAFDLAQSVSILKQPTHVQIDTKGSITHTKKFLSNLFFDLPRARRLACNKIGRFKENPFENFCTINHRVKSMLKEEEANHKTIMDKILNNYITYIK
jgi:glycosyltransferase involved in cell wall biosynthesis